MVPFRDPGLELASAIREVFSYISRFKGRIFLLKIEDCLLENPLFPVIIRDVAQLQKSGIRLVIVPGTRKSIDQKLADFGINTSFHEGVRLTSSQALPLAELASLHVAQQILSLLTANGCSGIQGNWIQARSLGIVDGIDYQYTGRIERVRTDIILKLLEEDFIPILPPIGWNKLGHAYNISSTELASTLCEQLRVIKLFFIGGSNGVPFKILHRGELTSDLDVYESGIVSALDIGQTKEILHLNRDSLPFTLREYLQSAVQVAQAGVNRVHIISGLGQGNLLQEVFSSRGDGTMIYANQYSALRPATTDDIPDMLRMMQEYIQSGFLVSRSQEDILQKLSDYLVYVVDNTLHGCGAMHDLGDGIGEIAAIAVDPGYRKSGVGDIIVRALVNEARRRHFKKLVLLTVQAIDWFQQQGFRLATVEDLPLERRKTYNQARASRVLLMELES